VFDENGQQLDAWVLNGTFEIWYPTQPFALALNGVSLVYGLDYAFDGMLNVTQVNVTGGSLRIYYSNPVYVESGDVSADKTSLDVYLSTPYSFNGNLTVRLYRDGELIYSDTEAFTALAGMNTLGISLPEPTGDGEYMVEVEICDEDSNVYVGATTASYSYVAPVEEAPEEARPTLPMEYVVGIGVLILLVIIVVLAVVPTTAAKYYLEKKKKYVKKKENP